MAKAAIIPAVVDHVALIAANVREADRAEFAANLRNPADAMYQGMRISSKAWTGIIDGVPVCMFGVAPAGFLSPDLGRPWMVGTFLLDTNAMLFLRRCKPIVKIMTQAYPRLENFVSAENTRAIQWLKWLGFEVAEESEMKSIMGVPFLRFTMEA